VATAEPQGKSLCAVLHITCVVELLLGFEPDLPRGGFPRGFSGCSRVY